MIKRRYGTSLQRTPAESEDVNPSAYITNIADCMLVLVLGLLVALITKYNVDLQKPVEELTGIQVNMDQNGDGIIDDEYEERGSVYYDSATGEYYMLTV